MVACISSDVILEKVGFVDVTYLSYSASFRALLELQLQGRGQAHA